MQICLACGRDRVHPISWENVGPKHWQVVLRCPDCRERRYGTFSNVACDAYDEILTAGTNQLARELKALTEENMAGEADRFVSALRADAVWPEDFGRPGLQV